MSISTYREADRDSDRGLDQDVNEAKNNSDSYDGNQDTDDFPSRSRSVNTYCKLRIVQMRSQQTNEDVKLSLGYVRMGETPNGRTPLICPSVWGRTEVMSFVKKNSLPMSHI